MVTPSSPPADTPSSASSTPIAPLTAEERAAHLQQVIAWRAQLSTLRPVQKRLLEGALRDVEALARGAETSAEDVLLETLTALVRVDVLALVSTHARAMHYATPRLRYLLDLLVGLDEATRAQQAQAAAWTDAQRALTLRHAEARALRNELLAALDTAVEYLPEVAPRLADVRGASALEHQTIASLQGIARQVETWLASPDEAEMLALVHVDASDAAEARRMAASLDAALLTATSNSAAPRDLPPTNVLEGRLMVELAALARSLDRARARNPTLPRLVLGNSLLRGLGRVRGAATTAAAPTPDLPAA